MILENAHVNLGILLYFLYLEQTIHPEMNSSDYYRFDRVSRSMQICMTYLATVSITQSHRLLQVCAASYLLADDTHSNNDDSFVYKIRDLTRQYGNRASDAFAMLTLEVKNQLDQLENTPDNTPVSLSKQRIGSVEDRGNEKIRTQRATRCKNGYHRVPAKTGKCIHRITHEPQSPLSVDQVDNEFALGRNTTEVSNEITKANEISANPTTTRRRCPNGFRRVPARTGNCVPVVSGGGNKWRLFSAVTLLGLSSINIRATVNQIKPILPHIVDPTICELLSAVYDTNRTPVHIPAKTQKRRGRPPKAVVLPPNTSQNNHPILTRDKCLWVGLLITTFPSVVPKCSSYQMASAILQLSGEVVTPANGPRLVKKAPEKCSRYIKDTLHMWTGLVLPSYYLFTT